MPRYRVYGSVLQSEVPFPDLPAAEDGTAVRWRIARRDQLPEMVEATCVGAEPLYQDVHARLYSHRDGWRIAVDDTGGFELGEDGQILAAPLPDAWPDFVRAHLLGRVLATMLYNDGWLPLHGSAVATGQGTIGFLGPKGVGKSSLAAALVQEGAPLVTDDTFPIEIDSPPLAWPGVFTLRVRDDAREHLAFGDVGAITREGKRAVAVEPSVATAHEPRPLAALFLLAPSDSVARADAAVRVRYSSVLAAAAVTAHVKCGRMLGNGAAAEMLARVARIVHHVPVYQLSITRDLSRLPDAARAILGWYDGPAR